MIGIYKITNKVNGKCYIGQSTHIEKRWTKHRNTATNPKYHEYNYPLYRAMRKYGLQNFSFEVLEECSVKDLNEKEKYYIFLYDSQLSHNGYNQDEGGTNVVHGKLTWDVVNEIKNKIKTTKLLLTEIAEEYDLHENTIQNINSGRTWRVDNEQYPIRAVPIKKISPPKTCKQKNDSPIKMVQKQVIRIPRDTVRKYYCSRCGQEIKTNSLYCTRCVPEVQRRAERPPRLELAKNIVDTSFEAVGRKHGVTGNTIKEWCKSYNIPYKINELKDWYYAETGTHPPAPKPAKEKFYTIRPVKQIHPQTKQVIQIFPTATDAVRHLGTGRGDHILEVCKGKRKTACGFHWEYA